MYCPIGDDFQVRDSAIIGIFDLDNTTWFKHTRRFLTAAEARGQVIAAAEDLPKAFVLTREFSMDRVYLTQFHTATMEKRLRRQQRKIHAPEGPAL